MADEPKVRVFSWQSEVAKKDPDLNKKQYSYKFSNDRKFESSDEVVPD